MNVNKTSLFWGVLLIGGGALALAQQFGYLDQLSDSIWVWIFALVSLMGFLSYALSGWKQWGWLFPAGVFGGLAVTIALATNHVNTAAVSSSLFIGLLIPFAAAYLTDRSRNWWALIPGGVMLFLTVITLLVDYTSADEWIGALFLFMVAASFFVVYMTNRTRTWALIVAYVMFVLKSRTAHVHWWTKCGVFWLDLHVRGGAPVLLPVLPLSAKLVGNHSCRSHDSSGCHRHCGDRRAHQRQHKRCICRSLFDGRTRRHLCCSLAATQQTLG